MVNWSLNRFRRITVSGDYIVEVDGLRFVAIGAVILAHTLGIWKHVIGHHYVTMSLPDQIFERIAELGVYGVQLFFMLSGFVLALPFCKHASGLGRAVSLKKYFVRRMTRLEPPYVVSMLFFFIMIPVLGGASYGELFPHLLASLAYIHEFVYNTGSVLNNNAWSLEIEIQFYLLVPLILTGMCTSPLARRVIIVCLIILFSLNSIWLPEVFPRTILEYFQYFGIGILFCELWMNFWKDQGKGLWQDLPGLVAWPVFFIVNFSWQGCFVDFINPWLIAAFFYSSLRGQLHSLILGWGWIPLIGGMCYSIYLIHARIITLVLRYGFDRLELSGIFLVDGIILFLTSFPVIVALSAIFFLLIEKPCMNPNWPKDLISWLRRRKMFL